MILFASSAFWADLIVSALALAALYALISTGFSISFNIGRFFDLSLGASFLAGGYGAYVFTSLVPLPLPLAMVTGVALAGALSTMMGLFVVVPLSRRLNSLRLFVATLAILYIAQAAVGILFGEGAQVLRAGPSPTLDFWEFRLTDLEAAQLFVALAVITALILVRKTRWGRYAQAVADDPDLAIRYGMPVGATLFRCYVLAGLLAGTAGVFYAANRAIEPTQAMAALLAAMVATIVGGETIVGAIVGAVFLALLETIFGFYMSGNFKTTVAFMMLLFFLTLRGGGALSLVNRRF